MKKITILLFSLFSFYLIKAQVLTEQKVLPQPSLNVNFHGAVVAVDGNRLVASSDLTVIEKHHVRSFDLENNVWVQNYIVEKDNNEWEPEIYYDLEKNQNGFGTELDIDGEWLIVGAKHWFGIIDEHDYSNGNLFIYKRNGTDWEEHSTLWLNDQNPNTLNYGKCISIQDNWLFVGASGKYQDGTTTTVGAVYIYKYDEINDEWDYFERLTPPNPVSNESFGAQLKVDNDKLIVTSYYKTLNGNVRAGEVYFYHYAANTWNNRQSFSLDATPANGYFGKVASLSGDYAFASFRENYTDKVKVFKHDGAQWNVLQDISLGAGVDLNGGAMSGNFIAVTDHESWYGGSNTGVAYLLELDNNTWALNQAITPSDGASADQFGIDVYLKGGKLAIGSIYHDDPSTSTGAVYVYTGFVDEPELNADFSIDPLLSPATTVVQYTDASTVTNTAIVSWSWDFDDDGIEDSDDQNPSHQFASAGNYPVTLTVSDGTIQSSTTKWVSHLSASNEDCLAYIPFAGTETNGQGIAGWNTDATADEAEKTGHLIYPPDHVAYHYLASRDYADIDGDANAAMSGNAPMVNWPNLAQALTDNGKTYEDLEISFGLMTLGPDVQNQDWTLNGVIETRKYRGGTFYIKLNGEDIITGDMPVLDMTIRYFSITGGKDEIDGETEFAIPMDNSAESSATAQAIAEAFMEDCEFSSIKLFFASIQPGIQMEFEANGRDGGFFDAEQAFLLRSCDCNAINADAYKYVFTKTNNYVNLGVNVSGGDGSYTFAWSPANDLVDSTMQNPSLWAVTDGTYKIQVVDGDGCRDEDSLDVIIIPNETSIWNGKGDWTDANNWSDNVLPANDAPVYIQSGTITVNQDVDVATFYADSTVLVKINEDATLSADSILQSDTTAIFSLYSFGSQAGNLVCNTPGVLANVSRKFTKDKWHYFGLPISGTHSANEFFGNFYIAQWNESNAIDAAWDFLFAESSLTVGQGYAAYYSRSTDNDSTVTYSGILNTGDVEITTEYSNMEKGWNLISNPYPCTIDWETVNSSLTNVNDAIYLWDPSLNGGDGAYATYVGGESTNGQTQYIPAGQGFFVRSSDAGGKVNVANAAKVINEVPFKNQVLSPVIKLGITSKSGMKDETIIRIMDESTNEFDGHLDAYKLIANNSAPVIYSNDGFDKYTINTLPGDYLETIIPIQIELKESGMHTLNMLEASANIDGLKIELKDGEANKSVQLNSEVFNIEGNAGQQFNLDLHITKTSTDAVNTDLNQIYAQIINGKLNVHGLGKGISKIKIYNVNGQLVHSSNSASMKIEVDVPKGIILVNIVNSQGVAFSEKLMVE